MTGCRFENNVASGKGGGGFLIKSISTASLTDCTFVGNTVPQFDSGSLGGGGVLVCSNSHATLRGCTFNGNMTTDMHGGAISLQNANDTSRFINCIFQENKASPIQPGEDRSQGGAVKLPTIAVLSDWTNSILWANVDAGGTDLDAQLFLRSGAMPTVTFSCIEDDDPTSVPFGGAVTGNIDVDPMFRNPLGGNFRLAGGSPCIDAADRAAVPTDDQDVDQDSNPDQFQWVRCCDERNRLGAFRVSHQRWRCEAGVCV